MASKKKKPADLTTAILIQIRDELTHLTAEVRELKDYTQELNRARVESETRLATAIVELRQVTIETRDAIRGVRQDERFQELEARLARLEKSA